MSLWDEEFDDLPEDDFLYDVVKQFRRDNPPPKDRLGISGDNPENDPSISYDGSPLDYYLYYGVKNLSLEQKKERLENAYYDRLMTIAKTTTEERAKDYIKRIEEGQHIPDEVISKIHDDSLSPEMEEEARKAAEQNYLHALRLGTLQAYHDTYIETKINKEPAPIVYDKVSKWKLNPAIEQVMSEKRGYDGNFYSWFFQQADNTKELDNKFFKTLRDGIEQGLTEKEIIDNATKVCVANTLNRGRIKNIVRTETTRAFNEGMVLENERLEKQLNAAGLTSGIIAYRFNAVIDGREWEGCKARHLLLIDAKDKELLKANTPPLHYFCRSSLTPLSERQLNKLGGYEQLEKDREKLKSAPVFKWRYTPDKDIFREADIPEN